MSKQKKKKKTPEKEDAWSVFMTFADHLMVDFCKSDDDEVPVDDDDNPADDDEVPDDDDTTDTDNGIDPIFLILISILIALVIIVIVAVIFVGIKTRREVWDEIDDPDAFMKRYSRTVREVEE